MAIDAAVVRDPLDRVVLEYIKSQFFRVIHVDGAIGGPGPSGNIHLAIYSERPAIPRRAVATVENGLIGNPIPEETVVRDGLVREMDVDMIMDVAVAEELGKLLTRIATETRAAISKQQEGTKPE